MIPRVLLALIVFSTAAYVFIWLLNHQDRAFVRRIVKQGLIALAVGAVATFLFIQTDFVTSLLGH